jgi:hypothetical protein
VSDFSSGYSAALADVVNLLDLYGEENMMICGDNILLDPLLHGKPFSEENMRQSRDCSIKSTIHSAQYHAAQHLLEQVRSMRVPAAAA